jgi:hypothetical protein
MDPGTVFETEVPLTEIPTDHDVPFHVKVAPVLVP